MWMQEQWYRVRVREQRPAESGRVLLRPDLRVRAELRVPDVVRMR